MKSHLLLSSLRPPRPLVSVGASVGARARTGPGSCTSAGTRPGALGVAAPSPVPALWASRSFCRGFRAGPAIPAQPAMTSVTSWSDPLEMESAFGGKSAGAGAARSDGDSAVHAPEGGAHEVAFWQSVADLPAGGEVKAALVRLGVQSSADLSYVSDQDLIGQGVAAVTARKLLAGASVQQRLAPQPMMGMLAHVPTASATTAAQKNKPKKDPAGFSPEETMKVLAKKGVLTVARTDGQIFCSSFLGGALLGWGCAMTTVVAGGTATFLAAAPGLLSLLTGAVFPIGLSMVLLTGSELLTGNFMTMALPAWTHPGVTTRQVLSNTWRIWRISGLGNLAGSLFVAGAVFSLGVVPAGSPAAAWVATVTVNRCALPLLILVGKGACANWLVNIAIFQATSAHTTAGKIAGLWLPIMTFVALGLEHSIANMFFLPLGMLLGAEVGVLDIAGNILPVLVGNALGAIIFVAGLQRYSLLRNMVYAKPL